MMVPDKFTFEFNCFNVAVVHFADDTGIAVVAKLSEFVGEIYGVHNGTST
jgi:hypothetical protein